MWSLVSTLGIGFDFEEFKGLDARTTNAVRQEVLRSVGTPDGIPRPSRLRRDSFPSRCSAG